MSVSESDFQRPLMVALNAAAGPTRVDRQNAGTMLDYAQDGRVRGAVHGARAGAGDLGGWVRPEGWHIEVEVKVGAPWTTVQRARARAVAHDGGIYVLVRWRLELDLVENVRRGLALVCAAILQRYTSGCGVIGGDPR